MPPANFKDELVAEITILRAFAISLSGSAWLADNLVQETLLRAWSKLAPAPVVSYDFVWREYHVYRPYRRCASPWRSEQWPEAPIKFLSRYRIGHCRD